VLFISALAAVLIGIALLLVTTGAFPGAFRAWPLLVMAVGGAFLYLALVRHSSPAFLFGGIVFVLEGAFFLAALLLRQEIGRVWPLTMVVGGVASAAAGLATWRRPRPSFVVPALCFVLLGALFSLFSYDVIGLSFRQFIVAWWPSLIIVGGILLFVALGLRGRGEGREPRGRRPVDDPEPRDQEREP